MTRPVTCLTLIAAAGAGLYLYQEKHRAQLLDREINRVVHTTEQVRERSGMMRAEWALLNEPDRLAGLAAQHLSLQSVAPAQFAQLSDLGSRLPAVGTPVPAAPAPAMEEPAQAAAAAPHPPVPKPAPALAAPLPAPAHPAALVAQTAPPGGAALVAQAAPPARPPRAVHVASRPAEPERQPVYAPVMAAFSQTPVQPTRPATVQQAAAGLPSASYAASAPYVGSALGMARSMLAAPVPVLPDAPIR